MRLDQAHDMVVVAHDVVKSSLELDALHPRHRGGNGIPSMHRLTADGMPHDIFGQHRAECTRVTGVERLEGGT